MFFTQAVNCGLRMLIFNVQNVEDGDYCILLPHIYRKYGINLKYLLILKMLIHIKYFHSLGDHFIFLVELIYLQTQGNNNGYL